MIGIGNLDMGNLDRRRAIGAAGRRWRRWQLFVAGHAAKVHRRPLAGS
jgi:hypothetical protein